MAANNLRIVYNNLAIGSTLTASSQASAALSVSNLLNDYKSVPWRSLTGTITNEARANLVVTFPQDKTVTLVLLPYTNMSALTTIRIKGWTGTAPTLSGTTNAPTLTTTGATQVFDTGIVKAFDYDPLGTFEWGTQVLAPTGYSGENSYIMAWIPKEVSQPCRHITIELVDTSNFDQYIQVSFIVLGDYWSPKFNTKFGLSQGQEDKSSNFRNEAGDLLVSKSFKYKTLRFDMSYLTPSDRTEMSRIFRIAGSTSRIFISLFPENYSDPSEEHMYQLYGKIVKLPGIENHIYKMYKTTIDIEEV